MFEMKPRIGIVVWVYNLHQVKQLRRYGLVYYMSRRMKYVYLYVDRDAAKATEAAISKLKFVRKVEISHRPELNTEYGSELDKLAEHEEQVPFLHPEPDTDDPKEERKTADADHRRKI